jgi:RNA polymerase sigma-70 factor, ECF subfamily
MTPEENLIAQAASGDRAAFDRLVEPHAAALRSFVLRLVGHPEDAADLAQEALLRGFQGLGSFRGDSSFRTWLFSIATRASLDHLRSRKRWRVDGQIEGERVAKSSEAELAPIAAALTAPDFQYSAREHVAFCFTCVGRSLPPEELAALLLVDVFELSGKEAAYTLSLSESQLRHRVADARRTMQHAFDGLCALVNKQGTCYQCDVLREATPPDRRGEDPAALAPLPYDARLKVVREADLGFGTSHKLHDALLVLMSRLGEALG